MTCVLFVYHLIAIFSGPMDQVVAPGDTAYFNCHARGNPVLWYIDGFILHDKSPFMARGFTFSEELSNGVANYTITIVAVLINNNTRIECRARLYNMPDVSQVGTLIIAGECFSTIILFSNGIF